MQQQALRHSRPPRFRHELLQVLFDQVWIVRFGQTKSLRYALDMGIDDDTGLAEGSPEYDIRCLPSDAWQCDQFLHRVRDLFPKAFGHGFTAGDKMFCFVFEETSGTNKLFEFRTMSRSHLSRLPIPLEE
jgi:hypothetical protein